MSSAVFEVSGLRRTFGATAALDGLSLHLNQGEVLGLIGPNGSGKSTLMRVLLGLIPVHQGQVRVFGVDPWLTPMPVRSRTGYASDGRDDGSRATVRELRALHRAVYPRWDEALADRLLGNLSRDAGARIDKLSKGQAQRVRLTCAMAHRPDLLLLDEPGGGLDPSMRRTFLEDAVGLLSEGETSMVITSHHLTDVERIASRVVLLREGSIVVDAELDTLQEQYCLAACDERSLSNSFDAVDIDAVTPAQWSTLLPGYLGHRRRRGEVRLALGCSPATAASWCAEKGLAAHVSKVNLEELYVVLVGGNHDV